MTRKISRATSRRAASPPGTARGGRARFAEVLLDTMYQFVALLDPGGVLLTANRAALDAVAAQECDVVGRPFWHTPWWSGLPGPQARLRAAVRDAAGGAFVRYHTEHRGRGGARLVTADFSLTPVRDGAGRIIHLVAEARDVTDLRRAECALCEKNIELEADAVHAAQLHAALEAVRIERDRAERASRAKDEIMALVSHELLSPVAAARLSCELLARDPAALTPRQIAAARRAIGALERLGTTIQSLLQHARMTTGPIEAQLAPVDVAALAADVLDDLRPLAAGKGLELGVDADPWLPPAHTDDRLLRVVLVNLAGNAVKFTSRGAVWIRISRHAGAYRIAVEDSGPGIPPEWRARVFEPFEHGEPVTAKHVPGLGLGLALARRAASFLGAHVELLPGEGPGCTFLVTLPPDDAAAAPDPRRH